MKIDSCYVFYGGLGEVGGIQLSGFLYCFYNFTFLERCSEINVIKRFFFILIKKFNLSLVYIEY